MSAWRVGGTSLDDGSLRGVERLVDLLLPGTATLPAARDVVDYVDLLERVFRADPKLVAPVLDAARRSAEAPDELTLEVLESWGSAEAETVVHALHSAYYMSAAVMSALHYPGQRRRPISTATPEERVSEELLAPVRDRGPVYVDPSSPQ
jgi:hypothetical protein